MIEEISNKFLNDLIFNKVDMYFENRMNFYYEDNPVIIQYVDRKLKKIGYELDRTNLIYFCSENRFFKGVRTDRKFEQYLIKCVKEFVRKNIAL